MEKNKKCCSMLLKVAVFIILISFLVIFCFVFGNLINKKKQQENNNIDNNVNNSINSSVNNNVNNNVNNDVNNDINTTMKDNKNRNSSSTNNVEIEYSIGEGGDGLEYKVAEVSVKIDSSGAIISFESHKNSGIDIDTSIYEKYKELKKNIDIDKEKFLELVALINEKFYKLESDLSDNSVLDGGSAYITVKNKGNDTSYTVGGYAVRNEIFSEIQSKIYETIGGYNVINNFRENEIKQFIENRENDISKYLDSLRKN